MISEVFHNSLGILDITWFTDEANSICLVTQGHKIPGYQLLRILM